MFFFFLTFCSVHSMMESPGRTYVLLFYLFGGVFMSTRSSSMEKVYVSVVSSFDATGYMQPTAITWIDGRVFPIESIRDYRPADPAVSPRGDCYTVMIRGQEKHLFFERTDPLFSSRVGRWFVKKGISQ